MKRLRDEVYMNSQFKRPSGSSSRGESYVPPQAPVDGGGGGGGSGNDVSIGVSAAAAAAAAGSTQKLTTNDALSYLKQVKDMFQDQREKYDRFLDVMKDFKAQRIDTAGVIARVKELFKGHPNLILGFNTFLPKGYEITLTDEEEAPPKRTVEFEEAISFVNKIKKRFQNDDHVYKSFLDILNMYRKEHKGITEVYGEVAALFGDHPDLLGEFTRFLPDASATAVASHGSLGRHSFHRYDERNSALPAMKQSHIEKPQRKDRVLDSNGERDLSVERPDMEEDKSVMKIQKEQRKHAERENRDRRKYDRDDRDPDNEINGDVNMHHLSDKRKSAQKVEDFGGNANFDTFEDKDSVKSTHSRELRFCEKVKERLCSTEDYQAFLKCLHIYSKEIISRHELQGLVADLLGKYPDLMEGFNEFFERYEHIDGFIAGVMGKKAWNEGNSCKASRIDDKEKEQRHEIDGGKEKERYNLKYLGKSIQELDLSNCERCTPSYRFLPDDYPICSASQRSELGNQVLNDKWVSVTSGSEDYSFKNMRKNQYEESLFRCEDDRFELDMLLESVSSTAKRSEELLICITDNSIGLDGPIRIEDHFTALNLRCIERLYGDHGLDVTDILRKNPSLALSVILTRLKQKQEEWTKCRSDFNKVWAEIYHKNHYKSLDHRSFYFKQQDSKNLSSKSLVAEIKELKEKMQKEDDVPLSIAAGSRHSLNPNIEFEYSDADVHEDVFRIIKYSCEEVCSTKDQLHKVLRLWTSFLEPMLGVHSRPHDLDTSGDGSRPKCKAAETTSAGLIESEGSPIHEASVTNLKQTEIDNDFHSIMSLQQDNFISAFMNMDALAGALPSGERLTNPEIAVTSGPNGNHGVGVNSSCVIDGPLEEVNNPKHDAEDRLSSEGGEMPKSNQLTNGKFVEVSRHTENNEDSINPCTVEKEEGELSPNGDFEDNFAADHDSGLQAVPEKNCENGGVQAQMGSNEEICADAGGGNDEDADDEDSENISEAGEDVSGSESAADECSPGHEEEEDGEHDELGGKAESECEADNTFDAAYNGGDGASVPQSERYLLTCKPLYKHVASPSVGDEPMERRIFYGSDTFYVLFRLHQTLYEQILSAKLKSVSSESKWRSARDANSDPYARFISALFSLLDGSSDNAKFEDDCRSLIGNQSYVLFTLDKLIYKLVKQLQVVSGDEMGCKLLQLFDYENSRKPEKYVDSVYYENVHFLLHDENVYRLESTTNPTQLSIQLMDDGNGKSEVVAVSFNPSFAAYLNHEYLSVNQGKKELSPSPIMLKRNMRKHRNLDESTACYKATENTRIMNGLECKMAASTSKISYVLDTEDSFVRLGWRKDRSTDRYSLAYQAMLDRFHQFLAASMA